MQVFEERTNVQAKLQVVRERRHRIETALNGFVVNQGPNDPLTEKPASHRRDRVVENRQQGGVLLIGMQRLDQFQVTHGHGIQVHLPSRCKEFRFLNMVVLQGRLGLLQITQNAPPRLDPGPCGRETQLVHVVYFEMSPENIL